MEDKQPLGKKFLGLSTVNAYGVWVILVLFPLILAGIQHLIDKSRSPDSLLLSAAAIAVVAASYMLRFYLVRNTESIRSKVLQAGSRERALYIIIGGFWWWLITLIFAIAVIFANYYLF